MAGDLIADRAKLQQPYAEYADYFVEISSPPAKPVKIQIELQTSKIYEFPPKAIIRGTTDHYDRLESLWMNTGRYVSMRSVHAEDSSFVSIKSDKALLQKLGKVHHPGLENNALSQVIGELAFENLTCTYKLGNSSDSDARERQIIYKLVGPSTFWCVYGTAERRFDGNIVRKNKNTHIKLGQSLPFNIFVQPNYEFTDIEGTDRSATEFTRIFALEFKTSLGVDAYSNQKFRRETQELTEILTLFVSFLSRNLVTYFEVLESRRSGFVRELRNVPNQAEKYIDLDDVLVPLGSSRKFFRLAFNRFKKLRDAGCDLTLPLMIYLSSFTDLTVEEALLSRFRALELLLRLSIKTVYPPNKQYGVMEKDEFKAIKASLYEALDSGVLDEGVRSLLKERINNLNAGTPRELYESLARKLKFEPWEGVYSLEDKVSLFKTRSTLVHGNPRLSEDELFLESLRVKIIFEKLVLSLLGWKDHSYAPPYFMRSYLSNV